MFEQQSANLTKNTHENSSMHYQDNDDDRELLLGAQSSKESVLFRWMSARSTNEHRKTRTRRIVLLGLAVVGYTVIVALIAGAFTSLVSAPSHNVDSVANHVADAVDDYPPLADCGHNSTTAQAAGCKFDLMMTGWSNPECLDSYVLEDSYNDASPLSPWGAGLSNWKWAADKEYKVELPSDPEELGHHDGIWTHFYFHKIHCAYVWRHLSHALARKLAGEKHVFVYKQALQYEHTVHCNWMVLEHEKDLMRPTWAEINSVNKCVELKLDLNGKPWTGLLAKEEEKARANSPGY